MLRGPSKTPLDNRGGYLRGMEAGIETFRRESDEGGDGEARVTTIAGARSCPIREMNADRRVMEFMAKLLDQADSDALVENIERSSRSAVSGCLQLN